MSRQQPDSMAASPLEEQIFQRMHAWNEEHPDGTGSVDSVLEEMIYQLLHQELKAVAVVLPGLGPRAVKERADYSCRFTSVLNQAFLRIIDKNRNDLMKQRCRSQLTGYVSQTMVRLMLSYYKRKGIFEGIKEQLGLSSADEAQIGDILSNLIEEKAGYFQQRTAIKFEKGLELIEAWEGSGDQNEKRLARVLRLRYVDGLAYEDIAREMHVNREEVKNLLQRAKYRLRGKK